MRLVLTLLPISLLLTACAAGQTNRPEEAKAAEARELLCHRTDKPPTIDGDLSDPAWGRATPITTFYQLGADRPANIESVALMLYDDQYLYLGVVMRKQPDAGLSDRLWSDNIEVFLDPGRTGSRYYQLAANRSDNFSARPVRDATWAPKMKNAGRRLPYGWSLEIALPLASLEETAPPKAGTRWRGNICRTDSRHGHSTAAPLRGGSGFHAPGAFLTIRFTDEPTAFDRAHWQNIREDAQAVENAFRREVAAKEQALAALNDRRSAALLQRTLARHTERAEAVLDNGGDGSLFASLGRYWLLSSLLEDMAENLAWDVRTVSLFE